MRHQARRLQALAHRLQAEPAQVGRVQQAGRLVFPGAAQQAVGEAPVIHVRHTDHHGAIVAQRLDLAADHPPRIAQVLDRVAVDDAVDLAVAQRERHRVLFDIHDGHLVEPPCRRLRRDGVGFDAKQQRAWIEPPIGRT